MGDSLRYQWRFNAAAIAGATTSSYTIASVDQTNAGSYSVVITNAFGAITSAPATLTVILPPVFTAQPTNAAVVVGSTAVFRASAVSVEPVAYQWQLNGTNIAGAAGTNAARSRAAPATPWPAAQAADAGTYTVVLTNSYGSITSSPAVLTLYFPPYFTTQPLSQTVIVGSNATFSVVAAGTPPFIYQWRFNGTNITAGTGSAYTITNAQPTNAGSYDVKVSNYLGSTNSQPATLTVVPPLTISGRVFEPNGTNGLPGVKVTAGTNSAISDANGNYILYGLSSNIYPVIPSQWCYLFGPSSEAVEVGPTNAFGVNFFATNDFHVVGGTITNGPADVTVTVTGSNGTYTTSSDVGVYGISNLCAGFYYVVPSRAGVSVSASDQLSSAPA